jgi:hypothetical protein
MTEPEESGAKRLSTTAPRALAPMVEPAGGNRAKSAGRSRDFKMFPPQTPKAKERMILSSQVH